MGRLQSEPRSDGCVAIYRHVTALSIYPLRSRGPCVIPYFSAWLKEDFYFVHLRSSSPKLHHVRHPWRDRNSLLPREQDDLDAWTNNNYDIFSTSKKKKENSLSQNAYDICKSGSHASRVLSLMSLNQLLDVHPLTLQQSVIKADDFGLSQRRHKINLRSTLKLKHRCCCPSLLQTLPPLAFMSAQELKMKWKLVKGIKKRNVLIWTWKRPRVMVY